MTLVASLRAAPAGTAVRVLFTGGDDERVLRAIAELARGGAVRPAVLGARAELVARAEALAISLAGVDIVASEDVDGARRARWAEQIAARQAMPLRVAARLVERPLVVALGLLADGAADAVIAGAGSHTREVLLACDLVLERRADGVVPSGAFVLDTAGGPLLFADCAVTPSPTADELAAIAIDAADAAPALVGAPARVAMLSFSTHGSASHPDVDRVVKATALARERRPALAIDGELQADAALDPRVALRKLERPGGDGAVAGRANVLVFPDLDAANIGYKLVRALAAAPALGVFVLGYRAPVVKLSRGSTVDEIVGTALLQARRAAGPTRA